MLSNWGKSKKVVSFELSSQYSRQRQAEGTTEDPRHRQVWAETVCSLVSLTKDKGFVFSPQSVLSHVCWKSLSCPSSTSVPCQFSAAVSYLLGNTHLTPFLPNPSHST